MTFSYRVKHVSTIQREHTRDGTTRSKGKRSSAQARAELRQGVPKGLIQQQIKQEIGGTVATDEKEAADLDFLERNYGVVVVLGNVLSRVVPRDRVKDEETDHDGDAQGRQLGTGLEWGRGGQC